MEESVKRTYAGQIVEHLREREKELVLEHESLLGGCEFKTKVRGLLVDQMIAFTVRLLVVNAGFWRVVFQFPFYSNSKQIQCTQYCTQSSMERKSTYFFLCRTLENSILRQSTELCVH